MFRNITTQWGHGPWWTSCLTRARGESIYMSDWSSETHAVLISSEMRKSSTSLLTFKYICFAKMDWWIRSIFNELERKWKEQLQEAIIFHTGTQNPCLMFPIGVPTNPLILSLIQGSIEPSWTDENLSRLSSAWVETTNQTSLGCLEGKPTRNHRFWKPNTGFLYFIYSLSLYLHIHISYNFTIFKNDRTIPSQFQN